MIVLSNEHSYRCIKLSASGIALRRHRCCSWRVFLLTRILQEAGWEKFNSGRMVAILNFRLATNLCSNNSTCKKLSASRIWQNKVTILSEFTIRMHLSKIESCERGSIRLVWVSLGWRLVGISWVALRRRLVGISWVALRRRLVGVSILEFKIIVNEFTKFRQICEHYSTVMPIGYMVQYLIHKFS